MKEPKVKFLSKYVTFKDIDTILKPSRLQQADWEHLEIDLKGLKARMDTLEMVTNHHVEAVEAYTPALIMEAKRSVAKGQALMERLEAVLIEQEEWRQRDIREMAKATAALSALDIWGRLRWLLVGR